MDLKAGTRLKSAVCDTEVIVVRGPVGEIDLRCGGIPLVMFDVEPPAGATMANGFDGGTLLGKRYADGSTGIEVLCTKAGGGSLSIGDTPLLVKEAKPLPASD